MPTDVGTGCCGCGGVCACPGLSAAASICLTMAGTVDVDGMSINGSVTVPYTGEDSGGRNWRIYERDGPMGDPTLLPYSSVTNETIVTVICNGTSISIQHDRSRIYYDRDPATSCFRVCQATIRFFRFQTVTCPDGPISPDSGQSETFTIGPNYRPVGCSGSGYPSRPFCGGFSQVLTPEATATITPGPCGPIDSGGDDGGPGGNSEFGGEFDPDM